jgi:hypothetical protein
VNKGEGVVEGQNGVMQNLEVLMYDSIESESPSRSPPTNPNNQQTQDSDQCFIQQQRLVFTQYRRAPLDIVLNLNPPEQRKMSSAYSPSENIPETQRASFASRDRIHLSLLDLHDNSGLTTTPIESDQQPSLPLDGRDLYLAPEQQLISAFREVPVFYDVERIKVVRISQNAVINAGFSVFESEAEAMRLVSTHLPSVRLP